MRITLLLLHLFILLHNPGPAQNIQLWGVASQGGQGLGTVYKINNDGTGYQTPFIFENEGQHPAYGLVQGDNGKFYGMTRAGGIHNHGVIFCYDAATNSYDHIYDFDSISGRSPSSDLMKAANGKLYGMTPFGGAADKGVLFELDPATNVFTGLLEFTGSNGQNPYGMLMTASDGMFYGYTYNGGTMNLGILFCYDPSMGTLTNLHNFGMPSTDGARPRYGRLIQASNGRLYGTTEFGGQVTGKGSLFSYDITTGTYAKLNTAKQNNPRGGLMLASNGILYIMNGSNYLLSYNINTGTDSLIHFFNGSVDGLDLNGTLVQASTGKIYGMTSSSGPHGYGTIFTYDPDTYSFSVILAFNGENGSNPVGGLIVADDGMLYGASTNGSGTGNIFSINPATHQYINHYVIDHKGANPTGQLLQASDGLFYGVTRAGGKYGKGVLFSYDPQSSSYMKLHDFSVANAKFITPLGQLLQASNGLLYGVARDVISTGCGFVYSYNINTQSYAKITDFENQTSCEPSAGLIQASNGLLYGSNQFGGTSGYGTLFTINPANNVFSHIFSFNFSNGATPGSTLVQDASGDLYGATESGSTGNGRVFRYRPGTGNYLSLHNFTVAEGIEPAGPVTILGNTLYGTARRGGSLKAGSLYSQGLAGGNFSIAHPFDTINGLTPTGVKAASDGKLYGTTTEGGSAKGGIIYSYDPTANLFSNLLSFNKTTGFNPDGPPVEYDFTVGMRAISNAAATTVWPNPAGDRIEISSPLLSNHASMISVMNLPGQTLLQQQVTGNGRGMVTVTSLKAGVYLLKLQSNNETVVKLFVKN